ncbi:hypothetical protein [Verrucosispora sp. WMMC514]|uniref:hypothetical protein n=1 Tax=Verrucosispora sp. WMMC514 TaxID=3015156 RepID=UPI00248AE9B5|nr:hypothetical protein [Verrucosispora sp. WMMC514]WBB91801.1 hypothetical protein O7597_01770 [Verrucosispora sp. WMMC514]
MPRPARTRSDAITRSSDALDGGPAEAVTPTLAGGLRTILIDEEPFVSLRPEEAVLAAMLDGWRLPQVARNLALATVEARLRMIRAFAGHVRPGEYLPN